MVQPRPPTSASQPASHNGKTRKKQLHVVSSENRYDDLKKRVKMKNIKNFEKQRRKHANNQGFGIERSHRRDATRRARLNPAFIFYGERHYLLRNAGMFRHDTHAHNGSMARDLSLSELIIIKFFSIPAPRRADRSLVAQCARVFRSIDRSIDC